MMWLFLAAAGTIYGVFVLFLILAYRSAVRAMDRDQGR